MDTQQHGVVLDDGTKIPFSQLQQTDPLLYKQYTEGVAQPGAQLQQTQASTAVAGEEAQKIAQEQQIAKRQQAQQQFTLDTQQAFESSRGANGYVSPHVYNAQKQKAAGLGINADDFDRLYEHNFTDPTSIDYNTSAGFANKNAQGEIKRQIQAQVEQYNTVPKDQKGIFSKSGLPGVLGQMYAPEATAYENSRAGLAAQLKGLIGGTGLRVTQPELDRWQALLPSTRNSDEQNNKNLQILNAQIKATFNTSGGLDSQFMPKGNTGSAPSISSTQPGNTGKDLLSSLLYNAGKDVVGDVSGMGKMLGADIAGKNGYAPAEIGGRNVLQMLQGAAGEYGDLITHPVQHATDHPVNTALDLLPLVGMLKGGAAAKVAGGADSGIAIKDPGALQKIFSPGKIKAQAGDMRDSVVNQSSQAGNTVSGDNVITQLKKWADTVGKPGNPGQGSKIDTILNEAEQQYKGKQIDPADAYKIYNEIDSGFNTKGVQKDAIQSRGDIALRQILRGELDKVAPGFDKLTNIIGQGYQAEKSAGAKIVKDLPKNVVKTGMNVAGLGVLREFIGL